MPASYWLMKWLPFFPWQFVFFRRLHDRLVITSHNIPRHYQLTHLLFESVTEHYHIFEIFLSPKLSWFHSNTASLPFYLLYFIIKISTSCPVTDHKHTSFITFPNMMMIMKMSILFATYCCYKLTNFTELGFHFVATSERLKISINNIWEIYSDR